MTKHVRNRRIQQRKNYMSSQEPDMKKRKTNKSTKVYIFQHKNTIN